MTRACFEAVVDDCKVFRLAEVGKPCFPATSDLPFPEFFVPSSEDRREAVARGRRVTLSVWDRELTTVEQARRLRWGDGAGDHETRAFAFAAAAVREIGVAEQLPIDVVDDRHEEAAEGPGAVGHCAILGLDSEEKAGTKVQYRSARHALSRACRPFP